MTCSLRTGGFEVRLPDEFGSYDLLEAVAIEIADGQSFWLLLNPDSGSRSRVWLSPNQSIQLYDDGEAGKRTIDQERVRALRRSRYVSGGQMIGSLAFMTAGFEEANATLKEAFEEKRSAEAKAESGPDA